MLLGLSHELIGDALHFLALLALHVPTRTGVALVTGVLPRALHDGVKRV
tara:strand:- start:193 stop:339 length:147 start_codon:yes stop_codon:yes gene_type:complete